MVLPRTAWKKLPNGQWAHLYNICTTDHWVIDIWEPLKKAKEGVGYSHSTQMSHRGLSLGRVGTNELPAHINNIPPSEARSRAVRAFYDRKYEEAYERAFFAFGKLLGQAFFKQDMGEVTFTHPDIIPI